MGGAEQSEGGQRDQGDSRVLCHQVLLLAAHSAGAMPTPVHRMYSGASWPPREGACHCDDLLQNSINASKRFQPAHVCHGLKALCPGSQMGA